jgi:hypothetical protein
MYDFEVRKLDWNNHINNEHNLSNYLNYINYLNERNIDECYGIERYVKECISKGNYDFIP